MTQTICSYCGTRTATDKEHVFPKNLYPKSKATSKIQRLTIPSCNICNNGWSDDEAHFRNILALAGEEPNEPRNELWNTKVLRSFWKNDGHRRIKDVIDTLKAVVVNGEQRHKIYPAKDKRVVKVVKKIVQGLSHHHNIQSALPESRIWVDVMKYHVPEEFLSEMTFEHREPDIAEYHYAVLNEQGTQSAWLITFFEKVTFIAIVSLAEG